MTAEAAPVVTRVDVDPDLAAPRLEGRRLATSTVSGIAVAHNERFAFATTGRAPAFFDVTELVQGVVARSGVRAGQVVAATAHTTCALIVQENEPLLLADLAERLSRFAAQGERYRHDDLTIRTVNVGGLDECANGHSHCQHVLLGASVSLPVADGVLVLGRWQRLLLVELDQPRPRELVVQVTGVVPTAP